MFTVTPDNIANITNTLKRINELRDMKLKLQTLIENGPVELKSFFEAYEPSNMGCGLLKIGSVAFTTDSKGAKLILSQCIKSVESELRSLGYREAKKAMPSKI